MIALRADENLLWKRREMEPTHGENKDRPGIQQLQFDRPDMIRSVQESGLHKTALTFAETMLCPTP